MKPIQKPVRQEREKQAGNNRTLSVKIVKVRSILTSNQLLRLRWLSHLVNLL